MPDIWMDVDAAISEAPVNIMPLLDDTDFKTRETAVAFNAAGMDLVWNFVTTAGAYTQTAVTPTSGGNYDWTHQGDGMYSIEIPASGGASINNDTEGFGWFTGLVTGVLPWRGPVIGFRASGTNNSLIDGTTIDVNVTAMAAGTVTASAIATGAIDADAIADNAIDAGAIASDAITAAKIATGAITSAKFAAGAIDAAAIATDAIGAAELADGAITAATFAAGAIDAAAIAASAIDAATFAADVDAEILSYIVDDATRIDASALNTATGTTIPAIQTDTNDIQDTLNGLIMAKGTIGATGNDTTHLHLDGLTYGNDELNGYYLAIRDVSESETHIRDITDWVLATELATVDTLPFTPQDSTDTYWLLFAQAAAAGTAPTAAEVADAVWDEAQADHVGAGTFGEVATETAAILDDTGTSGVVLANDAITAAKIAANAIGSSEIADGAITAAKIATDAIDADALADGAITAATFAAGAIDATAIATGAIDADAIADNAIDAGALAADAITAAKIADGAIDANTFAAGAITASAIAADAIGASELAADAVAEIADGVWDEALSGHTTLATFGQVLNALGLRTGEVNDAGATTTVFIVDGFTEATNDHFNGAVLAFTSGACLGQMRTIIDYTGATQTVTLGQALTDAPANNDDFVILPGEFGGGDLAKVARLFLTVLSQTTGQIDTTTFAAGAINAAAIATDAIGAAELADGAITAATFAAGAIDATAIANSAIDAATFAAGAIDAAAIADGAIDAATFAAGAITATVIATGAIDADAIADNAIDAGAIAADAITAAKIATGAIDADAIAADAITAAKIATGAIDADALAADAVTEIWAKAMTELSAVPGVTGTVLEALTWCFTLARNKIEQTSTTQTLYKDDASTSLATSTHSDDGTTHTRGEFA